MGISNIKFERKIIGFNLYWISILVVGTFLFLRFRGGNLINWNTLGFEVVFPFYTAIMIGECVKTRSDPMFEVFEAQSRSLFRWVFVRYLYTFVVIGVFALIGMIVYQTMDSAFSLGKFLFVYLSTAFFLSSLAVLCSMFTSSSHAAVAVCGIYWLFSMLIRSLLRISFVPYIYLFICFVDESGPIWFLNKCILTVIGIVMWLIVWLLCKKRIAITQ
ncbi:hypothetical protein ACVS9P_08615 [Caproicibacterium sp. NSD3]